jgi:hypothetical protein
MVAEMINVENINISNGFGEFLKINWFKQNIVNDLTIRQN